MKISFVIPCYRSARTIGGVVAEIRGAMEEHGECAYEIILVNDCSPDNTADVIKDLARSDSRITAVDLAKNVGQASALLAGFHYVSGDVVMTSDDDGQTPVGRVFEFYEELCKGFDVVCARYTSRERKSAFRSLGSVLNRRMSDWLIEKPDGVYMAAVFMARRFVTDEMIRYDRPYPYPSGLILRATHKVGNVDVVQRARAEGQSGYTLKKLVKLWMNGFTTFSIKPLRLSAMCGLILFLIGVVTALFALAGKIINPADVIVIRPLVALFLAVSGIILIFLGLVGEYIGRIYMCINEYPQYVVREVVRLEESTR